MRVALTDGAAHTVDSSELAFKIAAMHAFKAAYAKAAPVILEPIMNVEVASIHHIIDSVRCNVPINLTQQQALLILFCLIEGSWSIHAP